MRRNLLPVVLAVFSGTLLLADNLWAQSRGGTSGSVPSLFGSRTMGTPTGASTGTLGRGGLSGGLGGALGGGQGLSNVLQGSLVTGNERFVRGNQGGFIGADTADVSAINNSMSGAAGQTSNRTQNFQRQNATGRNGQRTNQAGGRGQNTGRGGRSGQRMLQTQLHVAFRHPEPVPATISAKLTARIRKGLSSRLENVAGVEVTGRLVTLRGTVASQYDRMVVEKLVMLEPGVSKVRNELRVVPSQPRADQPTETRP
jgi:osmotically-inducible protein OsmY